MKPAVMVVDFGTSKVSCMIAEDDGGSCTSLGAASQPYAGFAHGRWMNTEQVIDAVYETVRTAQNAARRRMRDVYIVVPGDYVRVVCGKSGAQVAGRDSRVSQEDMQRLIQSTEGLYRPDRYKVIHRSTAYYSLDARRMGSGSPVGQHARRLDGLIGYVLADTLFLRDVKAIADELGLVVRGYVASSLGQAMAYISPDERARMVALCDVGYMSTQVAVFQGEGMLYHETLPVGGFHIASDLTYGLDVTLDVAETIKRRHVFGMAFADDQNLHWVVEKNDRVTRFDNALVHQIIEARCEELAEMIQYCLKNSGFRLGDRAPLYISGGGLVMVRGAQQYLAGLLNRQVRAIAPRTATFNTPNHAALVGAADYLLAYNQEQERTGFNGRMRRLFGR